MARGKKMSRNQLERAARIYRTNKEAGAALGISGVGFAIACKREGVETPAARGRLLKE